MDPTTTIAMRLPSDQDSSGRNLGETELANLSQVIASGTLICTKGTFVKEFERRFADQLGVRHAFACSSGTAAIHAAVAALDPEPGDEFVTSPITDMGALTPILYQGAIPVFAETDPRTWNITPASIEWALSARTRAIIVTHLFGNPCDMDKILAIANSRGIPVIEDCAQSFLAEHHGQFVGTMGTISCFSLQQGKHITTGEGGIVTTHDDDLARRIRLFINKGWAYEEPQPDHEFLALNYRMSELQGAVALAQLPKLATAVQKRVLAARSLTRKLSGIPGISTPHVAPGSVHTFWKYCLRVDPQTIRGGCDGLGTQLKSQGISCVPRYIQKPAFMCRIFQEQKTFGKSRFPFTLARPEALRYDEALFPLTREALQNILVLPWNENYHEEHVNYIANVIHDATLQVTN